MNTPATFNTLEEMNASTWLSGLRKSFSQDIWPTECHRCQQTESINGTSIRLNAIAFDKQQTQADYLTVGGVLDNICNSACVTCNANLSTKIGSLSVKQYKIVDNTNRFWKLPQDRIVHLDLNGGEPSASKNYKHVLANLPRNVKSVRVNTNCSMVITELTQLLDQGIQVTVTVSLDGIGKVHDRIRWPIKWDKFYSNLMQYTRMPSIKLNTWTTVSALNIKHLPTIQQFCQEHKLDHSWALLHSPNPLNVKYQNSLTLPAQEIIPGQVAVARNNQAELDRFLLEQENLRK
jgi:sulfatase maturation enzyme AslB (radical SAM superfamily)